MIMLFPPPHSVYTGLAADNLQQLFWFVYVSARLIISKLQRRKLLSIQTRFLKKHSHIHKQAVRKFASDFRLT
jgi:hypothetical protein